MTAQGNAASHEEPKTVMKFALFFPASWTDKDTVHQSRVYGEVLEQVQYGEELGFDSLWIAEHHSSRYGIFPSLMPILAHIAAKTKTIRLGAGVSVLPFHNPIRLAEEAAMVDLLSNGRLNLGVGRGSADYEYGNFKIDFDSRDDRFREVLDIIGQGIIRFPSIAVTEGAEWEKTYRTKTKDKEDKWRFEITQNSKLEKIENGIATITSTLKGVKVFDEADEEELNPGETKKSKFSGKIKTLFDIERGEIVSTESEGKIEFEFRSPDPNGGDDHEVKITRGVKSKITEQE